MLSRAQRLSVRDFAVAFEQGRVLRHPLLHLRVYVRQNEPSSGKSQLRAAFVAPKKLGNAVVRNKIRRRARERFRLLKFAGLRNCDLLFMATAQCQTASSAQIDEAILQLLKRARKHVASGNAASDI